jgi:hypothetical protein
VFIARCDSTKAMNYVTKYLTKADVAPDDLFNANEELRKYRMFQRFGTWHAVRIPKLVCDSLCEDCGRSTWLTEWEIRRSENAFARSG